jgi:hypothetical protein
VIYFNLLPFVPLFYVYSHRVQIFLGTYWPVGETGSLGFVSVSVEVMSVIGGAEEGRTPGLRIANRTPGKNVINCLSKVAATKRF